MLEESRLTVQARESIRGQIKGTLAKLADAQRSGNSGVQKATRNSSRSAMRTTSISRPCCLRRKSTGTPRSCDVPDLTLPASKGSHFPGLRSSRASLASHWLRQTGHFFAAANITRRFRQHAVGLIQWSIPI